MTTSLSAREALAAGSALSPGDTPVAARGKALVVIPTYNEAGTIARLVQQIQTQILGLDMLIIDDNSPDNTAAIVEALAPRLPVAVLRRSAKLGIGSAHRAGFRYAIEQGYACVITMDADFTHLPSYLPAILEAAAGADVVLASRYVAGGGMRRWGFTRLLISHTAHWLATHVLGLPYDCTGGFRLYKTPVLQGPQLGRVQSEGYSFLMELLFRLHRAGYAIAEVPVVITSRDIGRSKLSVAELMQSLRVLVRLWRERWHGS